MDHKIETVSIGVQQTSKIAGYKNRVKISL